MFSNRFCISAARSIHSFRIWRDFQGATPKRLQAKMTLNNVIEYNKRNAEVLASIAQELTEIYSMKLLQRKQKLQKELAELEKDIEIAKAQLVAFETSQGKKQYSVPGVRGFSTDVTQQVPPTSSNATATASPPVDAPAEQEDKVKPGKQKKPKKEKPANTADSTPAAAEGPVDVGRLDMRVGKIIEVGRHPDADSLYLEKIDCGEAQPRTVVSGLVKFVPIEEMQNRMVVVLCNLKPAKMRGVISEAMVMCASTPEKVEVLSPPPGAVPGDLIHCEGYARQPDAQLNPKKKIFETCAPDLMTNGDLIATYKGAALHIPGKGNVIAQTLRNVHVK